MSQLQYAQTTGCPSVNRIIEWVKTQVAPCGTHHLHAGAPAYKARFDTVLKFHAPGLAPIQHQNEAWHIRTDGTPAYARRFRRCFGFYEQLSAVSGSDGWHHVTPNGTDAYQQRYDWCGNFQEGFCTVRDNEGCYVHITPDGTPAYDQRWHYAGDFRDNIAVVQTKHGHATHIDATGRYLHECWFLDLDVFHKGYARARDEDGWHHIDIHGKPVYQRRFANIEPFYNGQARVERFDGALEVIDEDGVRIALLRAPLRSDFTALSADMTGFWRTWTIHAAVSLGLFEALPTSTTEIATRCRMPPERAARLLRALGEMGLVKDRDGVWLTTARGSYLQADHPLTLADAAGEYAVHFVRLWQDMASVLQRNDRYAGDWPVPDIFTEVEYDKARLITHHRMLQSYAAHDYAHVPEALGLRGDERVVDAGGGTGMLAHLLLTACPGLDVTVMDRAGVALHAGQINAQTKNRQTMPTFVAGDIFSPWPIMADMVLLARVLHDWDDENAVKILEQARAALLPDGRLFVIERLLPEDGYDGGLCDMHLLMVTGGKDRTRAQYHQLLITAGFEPYRTLDLPTLPSIIEAVVI